MLNGYLPKPKNGRILIQGILNVTPDSFYDGGKYSSIDSAVAHGIKLEEQGADIIDVGGESSRPGCNPVSLEEEQKRVLPVIKKLVKEIKAPISIDTYKHQTARKCLDEGASIVNDITGLRDFMMRQVIAEFNVTAIIMHMPGNPKTMQQHTNYEDVTSNIKDFLDNQIKASNRYGITKLIIDPGLGFGKTADQTYEILANLSKLKDLKYPILIGPSNKAFLKKKRMSTLEALVFGIKNGAEIIRVHDVESAKTAIKLSQA